MAEGQSPRIEHVVVLMLENRSFDHMLGFLDHPDPDFDGRRAVAGHEEGEPAGVGEAGGPGRRDALPRPARPLSRPLQPGSRVRPLQRCKDAELTAPPLRSFAQEST
ncbi:MAG: hypothetical protein LC808_36620 [Actinobacteria bacterium]|nr:hypothetical protein [Actinomycetota bacterium]